jgi:hypothetical protein
MAKKARKIFSQIFSFQPELFFMALNAQKPTGFCAFSAMKKKQKKEETRVKRCYKRTSAAIISAYMPM